MLLDRLRPHINRSKACGTPYTLEFSVLLGKRNDTGEMSFQVSTPYTNTTVTNTREDAGRKIYMKMVLLLRLWHISDCDGSIDIRVSRFLQQLPSVALLPMYMPTPEA